MAPASSAVSGKNIAGTAIRCLVTAGPTREYLDPVRFLSNASSGRMGFALAGKAAAAGWEVDLVSGPVTLDCPSGVRIHRVVSAAEMLAAVEPLFRQCDILFMVAAVADYRPAERAPEKLKKTRDRLTLAMVRTPDILKRLAAARTNQVVVGFAAETQNLEDYAVEKLARKGMDWIVANDISRPGLGMEAADNEIVLLSSTGARLPFGPAPKEEVAGFILEQVRASVESRRESHSSRSAG